MNNTCFPTEIFGIIFEEFAEPLPIHRYQVRFVPRGYLTPLLRVSKQWYANIVKHLYGSIAVGSSTRMRGREIAKALCKTLEANSGLAALVKRLQLGIESRDHMDHRDLTETNTRILQLCPNVVHVEIRGGKLNVLSRVLVEKQLISFSMSSWCLADRIDRDSGISCGGARVSEVLDLVQNWPGIRRIQLEGIEDHTDWVPLDTYKYRTCPELREISMMGMWLRPLSYAALQSICGAAVTRLSICVRDHQIPALCEFLRAWSATLTHFRLKIFDAFSYPKLGLPLMEAIATLTELRVLELGGMEVGGCALDYSGISSLTRLVRIYCFPLYDRRGKYDKERKYVQQLSTVLEDSEKLPSLTYIGGNLEFNKHAQSHPHFRDICRRREIQIGSDHTRFFGNDFRPW